MAGVTINIGAQTAELTNKLATVKKDLAGLKTQIAVAADTKPITNLTASVAQLEKEVNGFSAKSIEAAFARIDAAIDRSATEAQEFKTQLVDLGSGRLPLTSIAQLQAAVATLKADLRTGFTPTITRQDGLNPQKIAEVSKAAKELPPGFNQAGFAVANFSRVVQDAPFSLLSGNLIAVSNNIDPLIHSFVQLKQQSGSGMAALKALGSSLIGSNGLLLGFSLVNAAITYFSAQAAFGTKEVDGFANAMADANKEAGEEIARLQVLNTITQDTTRSMGERTKAAKQLQEQLKDYNIQLSQEEILNGRVTEATKLATQAIIERAKARAVESRIAELSAKQLDLELKREAAVKKLTQRQKEFDEAVKAGRFQENARGFFIRSAFDDLTDLEGELKSVGSEIGALLNRIAAEDLTPGIDVNKVEKETDALKKRIDALKQIESLQGLKGSQRVELAQLEIDVVRRDRVKLGLTKQELQEYIDGIIEKHFPGDFEMRLKLMPKLERRDTNIDVSTAIGLDKIDPSVWDPIIEKMQEVSEARKKALSVDNVKAYATAITEILGPAFMELFTSIQNDGGNALEQFGETVTALIRRLIAAAATAALLAGVITLAFGGKGATFASSFKGLFSGFSGLKFAQGGIVTGPTLGLIGEMNRPEVVLPLDRLPQILGQMGGNGENSFQLVPIINNEGLYIAVQKGASRFSRKF